MRRRDDLPCPWCHEGRIILHDPGEPWIVVEEGELAHAARTSLHYPSGMKRATFQAPPVEWFSCSRCEMTGTIPYLVEMLAAALGKRPSWQRPELPAVKPGALREAA